MCTMYGDFFWIFCIKVYSNYTYGEMSYEMLNENVVEIELT